VAGNEGVGAGGEMTQALYAHMNNKKFFLIKKKLLPAKKTATRIKRHHTEWEKIFASHLLDKGYSKYTKNSKS
jgi:hypothetical protein